VHESEVLFVHARAAWILQDAEALREIDQALARAANPFEWTAAPANRAMSRAFVALMDGRLRDAADLLAPLAGDINRSLFYPAHQAQCMLADVHLRLGEPEAAARSLQRWCDEALASGEIGGAVLAGTVVLDRLAAADWHGLLASEHQQLLQRVAGLGHAPAPVAWAPRLAPARPARAPNSVEALSEREQEVLERIAAGDSNKLIARAFDLSPHTVKRHVANILGKLGVETRGQAAARWRERSPA
jgi:LuxR family maltose regulon positive regulatory protein